MSRGSMIAKTESRVETRFSLASSATELQLVEARCTALIAAFVGIH